VANCPGSCLPNCTCPIGATCGNNVRDGTEQCDGTDDSVCPGICAADCTCSGTWTCPPDPNGSCPFGWGCIDDVIYFGCVYDMIYPPCTGDNTFPTCGGDCPAGWTCQALSVGLGSTGCGCVRVPCGCRLAGGATFTFSGSCPAGEVCVGNYGPPSGCIADCCRWTGEACVQDSDCCTSDCTPSGTCS
jgi:hypothetical protein